jgi:DNA-binding transcriptional regulator GbsR (MarR family)
MEVGSLGLRRDCDGTERGHFMTGDRPTGAGGSELPGDLVRNFVEHWGAMARAWGINATMGELFALLYIAGGAWTADDLCARLGVSRGNVSMNLRELINWGVVHKVHVQGQRREYYRAETDVWTLFRRILVERKRRELDPTLALLERTARQLPVEPELAATGERVVALQQFFRRINSLATRLATLEPAELDELLGFFEEPRA